MISKILIGLLILVSGFLTYIAFQPSNYFIVREIKIIAPTEAIFPWINSSKKNSQWMPWADIDPKMLTTYSGPEEGVGAISSWTSEGQLGVGSATIIESIPNQLVRTKLEYKKPMEMSQIADISITQSGNESIVKWSVQGQNNFIGRVFCFFMNMEKTVGGYFEQGLNKLKSTVESEKIASP
jgi:hypothetical protein